MHCVYAANSTTENRDSVDIQADMYNRDSVLSVLLDIVMASFWFKQTVAGPNVSKYNTAKAVQHYKPRLASASIRWANPLAVV